MKRFFTKYGIMVLCIAVAVAVTLSAMAFFSGTSSILSNVAGIIASPFRAAGTAITSTVDRWGSYLTDFDALQEENAALKQQIAQMEDTLRQAELALEENARYRELIGLSEQRKDLQLESAAIVETDSSNWDSVLTINKGVNHNVKTGDCVIDQNGCLVGLVTEAGQNWSTVRTILDSSFSVGAMVFRSGQTALAQGSFSLMNQGRLALTFLGTEPDVAVGDLVVTSGLGQYLPGNLVIGELEELTSEDDGLSRRGVIRPRMELGQLEQVFVVTDFTIVE